jgi:hypothetical protein
VAGLNDATDLHGWVGVYCNCGRGRARTTDRQQHDNCNNLGELLSPRE